MPKTDYCANTKCLERMKCNRYILMLRNRLHPNKCALYHPVWLKKAKRLICKGFETIKT